MNCACGIVSLFALRLFGASLGSLLPTGFLLFAMTSDGALAEKGLLEALEIGRALGSNFAQEISGTQVTLGQDKEMVQSIFADSVVLRYEGTYFAIEGAPALSRAADGEIVVHARGGGKLQAALKISALVSSGAVLAPQALADMALPDGSSLSFSAEWSREDSNSISRAYSGHILEANRW